MPALLLELASSAVDALLLACGASKTCKSLMLYCTALERFTVTTGCTSLRIGVHECFAAAGQACKWHGHNQS